jgi:hypothetical protein
MAAVTDKPNGEAPKTLTDYLSEASARKTFANMEKLSSLKEYEIPAGSGIKYKRKILTPKEKVRLEILQNEMDKNPDDPQKRMDNIKAQAQICLEGLTDEKWEETDAVLMEIVIGACLVASKGFCDA